jgi:hypothetical protein
VTKLKKPDVNDYHRITRISDPLAALDQCSVEIKQAESAYWKTRQTYLGALAHTSQRISRDKTTWRALIGKEFWRKAYGSCPTMADRSKSLSFVIRYSENALKRPRYKLALGYVTVAEYLLSQSVKPRDFASYLGERGQGIGATYKRALVDKKLPEDRDGASRAANSKKPTKVAANDQKGSSGSTQKGVDAEEQRANYATMPKKTLIGKRELMEPLLLLSGDTKMNIRVKAGKDDKGRPCLKVVKLLSTPVTGHPTSERRQSDPRRGKPTSHGVKHLSHKRRRTAR